MVEENTLTVSKIFVVLRHMHRLAESRSWKETQGAARPADRKLLGPSRKRKHGPMRRWEEDGR